MAEVFVCNDKDMRDGDVRIVRQDRLEIGVYRHAGAYYAYRNHCLHQGGPACEGVVKGKVVDLLGPDQSYLGQTYDHNDPHIVCPWHGWEYKLLTGVCAPDPRLQLKKYDVVERDGGVYVVT
jgi:nitrite reductase (NADH) small subunit